MKSIASRGVKKVQPFDILNILFLGFLALMVIVPFYYTIVISITNETQYTLNPSIMYPVQLDFSSYKTVFEYYGIIRSFINSIIVVLIDIVYAMFLTISMAYAFSKRNFPGRNLLFNLVIFTMYFGGGLIPFYLVVDALGIRNSLAAMIIPFGLNVFNMIILKNFFQQLPPELEESARIDGAGPVRTLVQIILPMVTPVLATLVLFYAVDRWNEWFYAGLFISKKNLYPIQLTLREILWSTNSSITIPAEMGKRPFAEGIKAASVIVIMGPVMIIYPFLQRYFVKGIMIGAIKA